MYLRLHYTFPKRAVQTLYDREGIKSDDFRNTLNGEAMNYDDKLRAFLRKQRPQGIKKCNIFFTNSFLAILKKWQNPKL